jgi:hypothetical protein
MNLAELFDVRLDNGSLVAVRSLLRNVSGVKTMALESTSSKAMMNLNLALRSNCTVNIPSSMNYLGALGNTPHALYEDTGKLAFAIRESYAWNHMGDGLNFQL